MIELPDPQSFEVIADWVELRLSLENDIMSRDEVSASIEAMSGDEPSDVLLSDVWRELERRQILYKTSFYEVIGFGVEPRLVGNSFLSVAYKFCLFLSLYGVHDQKSPDLFERVTCCAVEKYLVGKARVWGWRGGSPIAERMEQLALDLNEIFSEPPPSHFKDRGVDVVGWKPFFDSRSGQLVVLTQCAAGHNWREKTPVPLERWCQYIHWAARPKCAFAVPCIVSPMDWREKSPDLGFLFDRARLLNLLDESCLDLTLESELFDWVEAQTERRES